ncbi:zinc knuckle [Trichuris suis]|nr:zinc knuckle [Trichuris suis]
MVTSQLLQSIEDLHLQYLVRRSTPTTVTDSVRELTIQQALLQATFLHSSPVIASAEPTQTRPSEPPITAEFQSRLHSIEESIHELQGMMIHDRSEHMPVDDRRRRFSRRPPTEWERRRAQCWKCQGFGHIARQCPSASGNGEGSSARMGRMIRNQ